MDQGIETSESPLDLPSREDIERLAEAALLTIPEALRQHVANVVFCVEDFPDAEVSRRFALASPFQLLGLYRGIALPRQSIGIVRQSNDMIFLYRRPLLAYWHRTSLALPDIVRHVVIHE